MTRLQTKCLIGSALFHGLTVVVFLATAAFRSAPTVTGDQVLNLIPAKILDDPGFGGPREHARWGRALVNHGVTERPQGVPTQVPRVERVTVKDNNSHRR